MLQRSGQQLVVATEKLSELAVTPTPPPLPTTPPPLLPTTTIETSRSTFLVTISKMQLTAGSKQSNTDQIRNEIVAVVVAAVVVAARLLFTCLTDFDQVEPFSN